MTLVVSRLALGVGETLHSSRIARLELARGESSDSG